MRRALLLLPLLLAVLYPLGVASAPVDAGPVVVRGPLLTPPNPDVYAAMPFVLQPAPQPVSVDPAGPTEELIAILVDFSDQEAFGSPADMGDLLFDPAPDAQSLHAFYRENSYDRTQVVGATTAVWYRAPRTMAYYGEDGASIDDANGPIYCLAVEAILAADPFVDFSQYDNDGDTLVNHFAVIHAGNGQETSTNTNLIWSHRWAIVDAVRCGYPTANVFVDGVQIRDYMMAAETSPLGVFVHEFGHDFGLPDLYDTTGVTAGIGVWGVMGTGSWNGNPRGTSPAHFTAWSKAQLGWMELRVVADALAPASIPVLATTPVAFKLPVKESPRGDEYFIVENRQRAGFDQGLPGAGLLLWHVDETFNNNNNPNRRLIDLEEADDGRGTFFADNPTQATDPWSDDAVGFTPDTFPGSSANDGTRTGWKVTGISPARNLMQANISVGVAVDLAILDASRPGFVRLNEPVEVDVLVTNRGLTQVTNGTLNFEVFFEAFNVSALVAQEARPLPPLDEGAVNLLTFSFTPSEAGTYLVESAAQVTGDEVPENNVRIVHAVAGQELFLEDVEGGVSGWSTSVDFGSAHRWEVVTDGDGFGTAHGPVRAWRFGDFGALGVPLTYESYDLTSPEIDLGSEVPRLLYHQRYELATAVEEGSSETQESDVARVRVSFDGGAWIEVASFTGVQTAWERVYVDLAPYAQGASRLRVRFSSTAGIMPEDGGWWIDDIAVLRVPLAPMALLKALESQKEIEPGTPVSFLFLIVNVGDLPANFTFLVAGLPLDWETLIGRNETSAVPVEGYVEHLDVDQQRALNLIVRSPFLAERGVLHQGILTALPVDVDEGASFVFTVQVPIGFGFDLQGRAFVVVLILGGVMLALAVILTALRRRRHPY